MGKRCRRVFRHTLPCTYGASLHESQRFVGAIPGVTVDVRLLVSLKESNGMAGRGFREVVADGKLHSNGQEGDQGSPLCPLNKGLSAAMRKGPQVDKRYPPLHLRVSFTARFRSLVWRDRELLQGTMCSLDGVYESSRP